MKDHYYYYYYYYYHHTQVLIFFFSIPSPAAAAPAVNPRGIETLLANSLITFFINGNLAFSNGPSNLPRNSPDCIILDK